MGKVCVSNGGGLLQECWKGYPAKFTDSGGQSWGFSRMKSNCRRLRRPSKNEDIASGASRRLALVLGSRSTAGAGKVRGAGQGWRDLWT